MPVITAPGGGGTAAQVTFTPAGTIAASNVQGALEEVASEAGSASTVAGAAQYGQEGMWALPFSFGGLSTFTMLAQRLEAVRFTPVRDMTVVSIKYEVTSGIAGADLDFAILDAALSRLRSSGVQADAGATTGVKTATLSSSLALTAGTDYYAAVVSDAAPVLRGLSYGHTNVGLRFGSTAGVVDAFSDTSHGTSIGAAAAIDAAGGSGSVPLLSLHE